MRQDLPVILCHAQLREVRDVALCIVFVSVTYTILRNLSLYSAKIARLASLHLQRGHMGQRRLAEAKACYLSTSIS